jgi:predicted nucleotidyltransferase
MNRDHNRWGLQPSVIASMHAVLGRYPQVKIATLYGSRAKGNFKPGSDIDLCLDGDQLTFRTMLAIANAFEELALPQKIDVIVRKLIDNAEFLAEIERTGTEFYKPPCF